MNEEDHNFLLYIKSYCSERPSIAAYIGQYAAAGVEEKLSASRQQCSDLESALAITLTKRKWKGMDKLVIDKIKDFVALGINHVRWDSFLEEYEKDDEK